MWLLKLKKEFSLGLRQIMMGEHHTLYHAESLGHFSWYDLLGCYLSLSSLLHGFLSQFWALRKGRYKQS